MRRVAFYAPMKSPHHPVPSGDREMARNLMVAIAATGRARVDLVSDLCTRDKQGDVTVQRQLRARADTEAQRLIRDLPTDTGMWVTYHNYYKVPDLIGPVVARTRNLPYVQIEASRAKRRLTGPWAGFAQAAEDACDAADLIFYLTRHDLLTLERDRAPGQRLAHLPPFLPVDTLPQAQASGAHLLTVAMMRDGDKLASYQLLAQALTHLQAPDWRLDIVGDGPAKAQVRALMAPFGDHVHFLGQLGRDDLHAAYADAGVFVWPGVNEGFGMVYLEAQSFGLPVVAQDRPGVRDVVLPGGHPLPEAGAQAMARRIDTLLQDATLRQRTGAQAREMIARCHLRPSASATFWSAVTPVLESRP